MRDVRELEEINDPVGEASEASYEFCNARDLVGSSVERSVIRDKWNRVKIVGNILKLDWIS